MDHFALWTAEWDVEKIVNINSAMLHRCLEQEAKKNSLIMNTGLWGT